MSDTPCKPTETVPPVDHTRLLLALCASVPAGARAAEDKNFLLERLLRLERVTCSTRWRDRRVLVA